jgi:hypothetical protein
MVGAQGEQISVVIAIADQRMTLGQTLLRRYAPGIPGAPLIPFVNSAFWRWIGLARPYCGRGEGFYVD